MKQVQIALPDKIADEAVQAGLLTSERLERWVRSELKQRRMDALFDGMDRMAAVKGNVMSPEAMAEEIAAMRAER